MIWGRLRRPDVLAGLLIAALLVICALFADWISPHSATRMVPKIKYFRLRGWRVAIRLISWGRISSGAIC